MPDSGQEVQGHPSSQPLGVMLFAAGLGTRFKPWTNEHPKALAPVNGKSLLERNIRYLQQYGLKDVVINVHHFASQITDAINIHNGWGSTIHISDERQQLLETAGGLKQAAPLLPYKHILLMNVDILTDLDLNGMMDFHFKELPLATLAVTNRKSSRYFLFDEENILCGWKNEKTGELRMSRNCHQYSAKAFSGIHIVQRSILESIPPKQKAGIVDVYLQLAASEQIKAFDHSGSKLIDVGKHEAIEAAEKLFA